jgi:signal transduction histidine kinase
MAAKAQRNNVRDESELEAVADPELSRFLFQVEEAERRRLARELHDETSQGLSLVRFHLETLRKSHGPSQKTLEDTFNVLDRTIDGVRRIVGRLSPQALEKFGLIGSIRKEARCLMADHAVRVDLRVSADFGRLSAEAELALYRLVQEALHNVAKHANAKNVEIDLSRKDGKIVLIVQDDGVGLVKKIGLQHSSYGIFGMRERVRCLNGTFRIRSRQGRGTRIEVYLDHSVCRAGSQIESNRFRLIEGQATTSRIAQKQGRTATGARNGQNQVFARG